MIIGKFSSELIQHRIFKNEMASSAIKSYVFIGKHIGLWFTQHESGFCTHQIDFFSLKLLLLGGPDGGPDGGSNGGPNGGSRFCTRPPVSTLAICEFTRETNV